MLGADGGELLRVPRDLCKGLRDLGLGEKSLFIVGLDVLALRPPALPVRLAVKEMGGPVGNPHETPARGIIPLYFAMTGVGCRRPAFMEDEFVEK